jgi:hypothetical protein
MTERPDFQKRLQQERTTHQAEPQPKKQERIVWREDRFKNVMKGDFMNEEWLKAEIKRSEASMRSMGYVGSPTLESLERSVSNRSKKSRPSR